MTQSALLRIASLLPLLALLLLLLILIIASGTGIGPIQWRRLRTGGYSVYIYTHSARISRPSSMMDLLSNPTLTTIYEVICSGVVKHGKFGKEEFRAVRIIKTSSESGNVISVRAFTEAKGYDFIVDRSLDPDTGIWRSQMIPGHAEFASKLEFTRTDNQNVIQLLFRHGSCTEKLFTKVKSLAENYDPDVEPPIIKQTQPSPRTPMKRNVQGSLYRNRRKRPYGLMMPNTLSVAGPVLSSPSRPITPGSAPARIRTNPITPKRLPKNHQLESMTAQARLPSHQSSAASTRLRQNFPEPLNFDKSNPENYDPNSFEHMFSPSITFSPSKMPPNGGLRNIGNSCYMNACISALARIKPFITDLLALEGSTIWRHRDDHTVVDLSDDCDDSEGQSTVLQSFLDVVRHLRTTASSDGGASQLRKLRQCLGRRQKRFDNRSQQDAHEFLSGLIDEIDNEIPSQSAVMKQIVSNVENSLTCASCAYTRANTEDCWNYSLDLPELPSTRSGLSGLKFDSQTLNPSKTVSTMDLFAKFFEKRSLEYRCGRCRSNKAFMVPKIVRTSNVLILHLKRFHVDKKTNHSEKRNDKIHVVTELDIATYCSLEFHRKGAKYSLRSIVSHLGRGSSNGHYVHDYRDPTFKTWTRYDDSTIRAIDQQTVLEEARTQAYLLFYYITC